MNTYNQYINSFFVDREVTTKKNATSGAEPRIPTELATTTQKQQTTTITNNNKTTTVQPPGYARKTSRKKNPQRKQKRKIKERILVLDKLNDIVSMEIQRELQDQIQTQTENQQDDNSSDAEVQQLLYDYRCFEEEIQEAIHNKDDIGIKEINPNRESEYGKEARSEVEVQQ